MPVNSSMRRKYRQNTKRSPCRGLDKKICKSKSSCMRTRSTKKKKSYCRLSRKKNKSSAKMRKSNRFAALANSTTKSKTASNSSSLSFYNMFNDVPTKSRSKTSTVTGD